jgi:hypothetical protein
MDKGQGNQNWKLAPAARGVSNGREEEDDYTWCILPWFYRPITRGSFKCSALGRCRPTAQPRGVGFLLLDLQTWMWNGLPG